MLYSKIKCVLLHNEEASILIMTLVVSLMLVVFSAGILILVSTDARGTLQTARLDSALNVAEAGVEEALWEFKFGGADFNGWSGDNPKTKTGLLQTNSGDTVGEYLITVTDPAENNPKIQVTGYTPGQANALAQRTIQVFVEAEKNSDFNMAAFGTESVNFDKEIKTDSYNSTNGAYGPGNKNERKGHVGTDSTEPGAITLGKENKIYGNVIIGPGGVPGEVISKPAELEIYPEKAIEETDPQPKPAPTGLTVKSDIAVGDGDTFTIYEDGEYHSVTLGKKSTLVIDAEDAIIYVKEVLNFDKESQVKIPFGKSAKIYLDDVDFILDRAVTINNESKNPAAFGIYGTPNFTRTIQIKKETEFYGVIHAPNGTIDINKEAKIYGALVAKKIVLDQKSAIHFDAALLDIPGDDSTYTMTYWQEK